MVIGIGRFPAVRVSWLTSGPVRPFGPGAQHQHADLGVVLDLGQDLRHRLALADHQFRVHPLPVAHPFGEDLEMRLDPLARLGRA